MDQSIFPIMPSSQVVLESRSRGVLGYNHVPVHHNHLRDVQFEWTATW